MIKDVHNCINGEDRTALSGKWFEKIDPSNGKVLYRVALSRAEDIEVAVQSAKAAQSAWGDLPPVERGMILHRIVRAMQDNQKDIAQIVASETGKSYKDAYGETGGSIALGLFFAGEGQRLYGRTTTSGTPNRFAMVIRQPIGIAGLIVPANTPIANVAWKVFPALVCGNSVVLKSAEDAPATSWIFGQIARKAGLPAGVLNIIHGHGAEAGAPLVAHPDVGVISFTGSTEVGRQIQRSAGERFAKVSLELGGKNPFIVCDDADLTNAVHWASLSAFSNAGQRCASGSRIIVFDSVYDRFRDMLIERVRRLKVGSSDEDDLGPVINLKQLNNMLTVIQRAKERGASILTGGYRMDGPNHRNGFFISPTLIENADPADEISRSELFGPIACLYRVKDYSEALTMANDSDYGLTACIHTRNVHRAMQFAQEIKTGVAMVNAGTFGSEPHMPFGGLKQSGNGTREPGTEALDIYSNLKDIYITIDPKSL